MEGFIILIIIAVIGLVLCGPIALIVAIVALKKTNQLFWDLREGEFVKKAAEKPTTEEKAKIISPTFEQAIKQASEFEPVKQEKPKPMIEPAVQKPKEAAITFSAEQVKKVSGTLRKPTIA